MTEINLVPFLTRLLSLHDPHADKHSTHVSELSTMVGKKIGLPAANLKKLEFAATIHDIGKLAINDYILTKPGRYTEAEYMMIQQHTTLGSKLIQTLQLDPLIDQIILFHHENFDGSGYPNRVKGEKIPVEARIIRITDTYDALTSNRGYRRAFTHKESIRELERSANCYDPDLLEVFLRLKFKSPGARPESIM